MNAVTSILSGVSSASLKTQLASDWHDKPTPERLWIVKDWIPVLRATLLTGEGGAGKSLLAQQMATFVALGLPFMGIETRKQRALYLTCEDDPSELHRRQKAICASMGVPISNLGNELHIASRIGETDNTLIHFCNDGTIADGDLLTSVRDYCTKNCIFFVVLDNISHLFDGNENDRHQVATFCSALDRLAMDIFGAVLFIGHPPKSGAQFSGSTAWENQVRSRLFLERPECDSPDLRELQRSKSNYASTGDKIKLQWRDWAFTSPNDDGPGWLESMNQTAAATKDNALFMQLLAIREGQGRRVSGRNTARNFAPREFAKMPQSKGLKVEQFEKAMERLFALSQIHEIETKSKTDRHTYRHIAACGPVAGQLFDTAHKDKNMTINHSVAAFAGQPAGQPPWTSHKHVESVGNAGLDDAGQLRGSYGYRGGEGDPPKGGFPSQPAPDDSDLDDLGF